MMADQLRCNRMEPGEGICSITFRYERSAHEVLDSGL